MSDLIIDAATHHKWTNLRLELQKVKAQLIGSPSLRQNVVNYFGKPDTAGLARIANALEKARLANEVSVDRIVNSNYYMLSQGKKKSLHTPVASYKKAKKPKSNRGHHYAYGHYK